MTNTWTCTGTAAGTPVIAARLVKESGALKKNRKLVQVDVNDVSSLPGHGRTQCVCLEQVGRLNPKVVEELLAALHVARSPSPDSSSRLQHRRRPPPCPEPLPLEPSADQLCAQTSALARQDPTGTRSDHGFTRCTGQDRCPLSVTRAIIARGSATASSSAMTPPPPPGMQLPTLKKHECALENTTKSTMSMGDPYRHDTFYKRAHTTQLFRPRSTKHTFWTDSKEKIVHLCCKLPTAACSVTRSCLTRKTEGQDGTTHEGPNTIGISPQLNYQPKRTQDTSVSSWSTSHGQETIRRATQAGSKQHWIGTGSLHHLTQLTPTHSVQRFRHHGKSPP